MVTDARVTIDGATARLYKHGPMSPELRTALSISPDEFGKARPPEVEAELGLTILSPKDAVFDVESTTQARPQNPNTGTRKLVVRLPGKVTSTRIEVAFR
jgi:hypothetical protein